VKAFFSIVALFGAALASSAETTNIFERFSPHFSTNTQIVWQAPTNHLPKSFWIYKRLPARPFSAAVISNAIALASLQDKEFPKPSTNAFFIWSAPNGCGVSRSIFSIIPASTAISFSSPDQNLLTNDVPDAKTVSKRAFEYAARFGVGPVYLLPMRVYAASNAVGCDTVLTNGFCARGINLVRKLDGVGFFSLGSGCDDVEGFSVELGSHGQVRAFSLVWPNLERDREVSIASPEEIIGFIRRQRFIVMPEDGENYFQRIKMLAQARQFTITGITPYYAEGTLGETPTDDVPPPIITPSAELDGVADLGNSNVTVRLLSPILSPDLLQSESQKK